MNIWSWMVATALAILASTAVYVRVRWRRAIASVLAGVLIGYSAKNHLLSGRRHKTTLEARRRLASGSNSNRRQSSGARCR